MTNISWQAFICEKIYLITVKLDQLDFNILQNLQEDGRMSFRELGRKLDIPHTTVYTRVNRLKRLGIIKKFSAVIHPHDSGGQLGVIIVNTPPSESKRVAEEISGFDEAKKVFRTFDGKIVIKAVVPEYPDQRGLEFFLTKLNGYPMEVYPAHEVIKYDHDIHSEIIENLVKKSD